MINKLAVLFLTMTTLSLYACNADQGSIQKPISSTTQIQAVAEAPTKEGIPWFDGSIDEAFATARTENKPVFLYWGAQWCPPCHELKATIFLREEFIEQSKLFVPVYLDGDTERAQQYGEKFGVQGYPTVIIFDPAGIEITRIPGGMNIEQYVGVLELALNALHPVKELLLAVQAGQDIRDDDWQLLANYSWDQDRGMALGDGNLHLALRNMAAACPDRLAATKSKLQMLAVGAWARNKKRDESLAPQYMVDVQRILQDRALARDNLSLFITAGADIVKAMPGKEQAAALREQIATLLATTVGDTSMGVLARIEAIYAWVEVNKTALPEDGELSAAQQDWVKAQVAATRSQINNYQQHTALNTISQIYLNAGLVPEARTTLLEGIEISSQPYYFMSGMAYLEKQAGNADAAIAWHKQAWDAAQGPATRIQWGSNYLFALIALSPDDIEGIRAAGTILFNELAQQKDGLHQRTSGRMNRLSRMLLAWAEPAAGETTTAQQRQLVLNQLRSQMDKLCSGAAPEGEGFATCESFLEPGASA